jgi:hypothetical protein
MKILKRHGPRRFRSGDLQAAMASGARQIRAWALLRHREPKIAGTIGVTRCPVIS